MPRIPIRGTPVLAILLVISGIVTVSALGQVQDPPDPQDELVNEKNLSIPTQLDPSDLGDELFLANLTAATGHVALLGIEYVDGYYYVTSGGQSGSSGINYLFKLEEDGSVVSSWLQNTSSTWGWRDLAWDGTYLYASDSSVIDQIDPTNGAKTGVTIPSPVNPARGLAYDPVTDHFWTANFSSDLYEIDRSGTIINNYSNLLSIYGLGWDSWTNGGPFLWAWSQDGSPLVFATQFDPKTGAPTGLNFQGSSIDGTDLAGGATVSADRVENKVTLITMHQSGADAVVGYELSELNPEPPAWGKLDSCIPAEEAPFAFVNQPWDWVEGAVDPFSTIQATLTRGPDVIVTATVTSDENGWFSFDFQEQGSHVNIIRLDEVMLTGGGLNDTITIFGMVGRIDVAADSVAGRLRFGDFDVWGVVCVRQPFDVLFESKEAYFDANGRFDVQFGGQVDIEFDYVAQVVYPDPNGNYIVQVIYPEGLDLSVLITEDRVEGLTTPGSTVSVVVWDQYGEKGITDTTADSVGFYSTAVFTGGEQIDLELGDHVGVSNDGHSRETTLLMTHESWLKPWDNRIEGTVGGMSLPTGGSQGRVDLWSSNEGKWFTQYVWIEEDGQYGADFNGIVDMSRTDRIRLWVSDGNGVQQASFGMILELGVSTSHDKVWGFTTPDSIVVVSLYRGLVGGFPQDIIGEAAVLSDAGGYFTATLMWDGSPAEIMPSNVLQVENSELVKSLFIGELKLVGDVDTDMLTLYGPADAVVHVEGFRPVRSAENSFFWVETTIESNGMVTIEMQPDDLQEGDIFDIVAYLSEDNASIQHMMAIPISSEIIIKKVTDPSGSSQDFTFSTNFTGTFVLADGEMYSVDNLEPSSEAGTYSVIEEAVSGWSTVSSCDNGDDTDSIYLHPGNSVTCTFTNTIARGEIIVRKVTDPGWSSQEFEFTANYTDAFTLTGGMQLAVSELLPSSEAENYSVSEASVTGWITESSCDDGSNPSDIDLDPGEIVTCTFTNTIERGEIIVEKVTDPGGSSQVFTFTASFTDTFNLLDGESHSQDGLLPYSEAGTYFVSEDAVSGWTTTSSCDNSDSPSAITLLPGQTVTCVFTNTIERGEIIVEKVTNPGGSSQVFTFTASFTDTFNLMDGESHSQDGLLPSSEADTYSVSEDAVSGWTTTSSCDNSDSPSAITLLPGQTVTCVFTNTIRRGEIIIEKITDPGGSNQVFNFTASFTDTFDLMDGESLSQDGLLPSSEEGTYSVSEQPVSGWIIESSCDNGDDPSIIFLEPGATVTCTFTNTIERGEIVIKKITDPPDSLEEFTFITNYTVTLTLMNGDIFSVGDLLPSSEAGAYSINEIIIPGWIVSSDCDNGDNASAIELEPGATVICTFTNTSISADFWIFLPVIFKMPD